MRPSDSTRPLEETWIVSRVVKVLDDDHLAEWLTILLQSAQAYETETGMSPPSLLAEKVLACAVAMMSEIGTFTVLRWAEIDLGGVDEWVDTTLNDLRARAARSGQPLGQTFLVNRIAVERDARRLNARIGYARIAVSSLWHKIEQEDPNFGSAEQLAAVVKEYAS